MTKNIKIIIGFLAAIAICIILAICITFISYTKTLNMVTVSYPTEWKHATEIDIKDAKSDIYGSDGTYRWISPTMIEVNIKQSYYSDSTHYGNKYFKYIVNEENVIIKE